MDDESRDVLAVVEPSAEGEKGAFDATAITRPHDSLLTYYIPRDVRFKTMRYRFDDEGVSRRWG